MIIYQVSQFLNVSFFESFCSFKVGCLTVMTNTSRSELNTEKHDQGVKRDAWLVLDLPLDFHANSNK